MPLLALLVVLHTMPSAVHSQSPPSIEANGGRLVLTVQASNPTVYNAVETLL